MGFQDRLDALREQRGLAQRERAEAAEHEQHERAQLARAEGLALLPEALEAVEALRRDRQRSEAWLMTLGGIEHRGTFGLGPIVEVRRERERWRWGHGAPVRERRTFLGWWVRREPFEFVIPLEGEPTVGIFQSMNLWVGPKATLDSFVRTGVHEFRGASSHEDGPSVQRSATAGEGLRALLDDIETHLLHLQ